MTVLDLIPQTEKETLKFRLLALMAVALAFLYEADEIPLIPTLAIVSGYLIYSYFLRTFLIRRYTSYPLLGAMLLVDVGTVIVALHLIGLNSPLFGLLPIVVVYYSVYLGYIGGIATASASAAGYTGLVLAKDQVQEMENLLVIQPFFYVLALLVGYISQQRFQESEERRALQQLIGAEVHAKSLLDLAQALNRAMDPVAIFNDVARMGSLVARVPLCIIFMHDRGRDVLVYRGSNLDSVFSGTGDREDLTVPLEADVFPASAWMGERIAYLDEPVGSRRGFPKWLGKLEVGGALASPLTNDGEKIGVISFLATGDAPDIEKGTEEAVIAFSEVAGRILGKVELSSQAERRSRRVAADLQRSIEMAGRLRELTERRSMRFGPMVIEPTRELVRWQDSTLRFTKTEFDLLYVLAEKSGNVLNSETLIREVWGQDYVPQGKVVDVTIHRLRRKLSALPEGRKLIRTVRGQGYTFVPPERFASS